MYIYIYICTGITCCMHLANNWRADLLDLSPTLSRNIAQLLHNMCHDSFIRVTWSDTCDMKTHSYTHDSCLHTWLILTHMTHSLLDLSTVWSWNVAQLLHVCHDSFTRVTWITMCEKMTYSYIHNSFSSRRVRLDLSAIVSECHQLYFTTIYII